MPEKEMPAKQSLAFLLGSLYHEFATQESLLSCAEFMNDKIIEHKVRQMQRIWILELLYHTPPKKDRQSKRGTASSSSFGEGIFVTYGV